MKTKFYAKFYCNRLNVAACSAPTKLRYIHRYTFDQRVLLGSRGHDETMMKFSGSRTMRVNAIGIFLRNLPKTEILLQFRKLESTVQIPVLLNNNLLRRFYFTNQGMVRYCISIKFIRYVLSFLVILKLKDININFQLT